MKTAQTIDVLIDQAELQIPVQYMSPAIDVFPAGVPNGKQSKNIFI